ncbi:MAG: arginine--tRNA ligase, partial [Ginsengibacter sp.]
MSFQLLIESAVIKSLAELFALEATATDFQINETKTEFTGDYTIVLFALVKKLKKSPEAIGQELGEH